MREMNFEREDHILYVEYGIITDHTKDMIPNRIKDFETVKSVDIRRVETQTDGAYVPIFEMLETNHQIEHISIMKSSLRDKDAVALAKALSKTSSLSHISLPNNLISKFGATELANALEKNCTVLEIGLYGNRIGDEGTIALAIGLKKNSRLTSLYLESKFCLR